MNLMRFREAVKAMVGYGAISSSTADTILSSPVFVGGPLDALDDQQSEWCEQHIMDESKRCPKHLPFPVFSALYSIPSHVDDGITDHALIVWGNPYRIDFCKSFIEGKDRGAMDCKFGLFGMMTIDKRQHTLMHVGFRGTQHYGLAIDTYNNGRRTTETVMGDQKKSQAASEIARGLRNTMLKVVFDIMNPGNIVLRVTPNKDGKSVQWIKAREHYCIINKTHAARCLKERRGPTEIEIERSAHWRRAHMRRLMSNKFTHKKGQLVFVKQSWVGPEEWEGSDRKTYKIITPRQP